MDKTLFQKYLLKLLVKMLPLIINNISPEIRTWVISAVNDLEGRAEATENPFDDFLVDLLKLVLDIE